MPYSQKLVRNPRAQLQAAQVSGPLIRLRNSNSQGYHRLTRIAEKVKPATGKAGIRHVIALDGASRADTEMLALLREPLFVGNLTHTDVGIQIAFEIIDDGRQIVAAPNRATLDLSTNGIETKQIKSSEI